MPDSAQGARATLKKQNCRPVVKKFSWAVLLILHMYHSPGVMEEFLIVGCMLIAHIHEGLYLAIFLKGAFCMFKCPS